MQKIRKDDEVIVITGKNKGKVAKVLQLVAPNKVLVDGVNVVKKHAKPNPAKNITGGVIDKVLPIDISNVALYNSATKKADKVSIVIGEDGKKQRKFKSNGNLVD